VSFVVEIRATHGSFFVIQYFTDVVYARRSGDQNCRHQRQCAPGKLHQHGVGVIVRVMMVWYLYQEPVGEAFRR
jgi:hypothetical protein